MKDNYVSMASIKEVIIKTRPLDWREFSVDAKKALQEMCHKMVIDFTEHIHKEQQHKPKRKVYEDDVNAAFASFYWRGKENE
jgi:hypothetical protein